MHSIPPQLPTRIFLMIAHYFIDIYSAHTTRDLMELEKLHDARVKRLESQLAVAKKRATEANDQVNVLNRQVMISEDSVPFLYRHYLSSINFVDSNLMLISSY